MNEQLGFIVPCHSTVSVLQMLHGDFRYRIEFNFEYSLCPGTCNLLACVLFDSTISPPTYFPVKAIFIRLSPLLHPLKHLVETLTHVFGLGAILN